MRLWPRRRNVAYDGEQMLEFDAQDLTAPPIVRSNWERLNLLQSLTLDLPSPANREAYPHYNIRY
jgi:hypothetical protein